MEPGRYVVAVSGGVDSMVLLDILRQLPGVELVVAHLDHGIRPDSAQDRQLVERTAARSGLSYIYDEARLGPHASEATARAARYQFLRRTRAACDARAIVTAHHQDDLLETALLNMWRGTGRKGLSSLTSTDDIRRPLLHVPKSQLLAYARAHNIQWRTDSTNADTRYRRNYLRQHIMPRLTADMRAQLLACIASARQQNQQLDALIINMLHTQPGTRTLDRQWFIGLPHAVAREVLAAWLRRHGIGFDRRRIERLVVAFKTAAPHARLDVGQGAVVRVSKRALSLG